MGCPGEVVWEKGGLGEKRGLVRISLFGPNPPGEGAESQPLQHPSRFVSELCVPVLVQCRPNRWLHSHSEPCWNCSGTPLSVDDPVAKVLTNAQACPRCGAPLFRATCPWIVTILSLLTLQRALPDGTWRVEKVSSVSSHV